MTDTSPQVSPLWRRMIEDITMRNLSPATQRSYIHGDVICFGPVLAPPKTAVTTHDHQNARSVAGPGVMPCRH